MRTGKVVRDGRDARSSSSLDAIGMGGGWERRWLFLFWGFRLLAFGIMECEVPRKGNRQLRTSSRHDGQSSC